MKTRLLTLLLLVWGAVGCSDDDSSQSQKDQIDNAVKDGTWRITYFWDTDHEETDHFTGYNFTFGASDVLTATNGANTYTGTWSVINDSGKTKFIIAFSAPPDFEELSEDWEIITNTSTKIELKHVSGGGGGTDYLTFQKN
jgi:hypothetical protein